MNERIRELAEQAFFDEATSQPSTKMYTFSEHKMEKFAALVAAAEREECAREVEEFARKWWSIHCHSNKHAETTRKAHDDFCLLQAAIRKRGKTV